MNRMLFFKQLDENYFSTLDTRAIANTENEVPNFPSPTTINSKNSFAAPTTKEDLISARSSSIPKKTLDDMAYCMRIWDEWRQYRLGLGSSSVISLITDLSKSTLDEQMSHFVLEIRKKDGKEYPPKYLAPYLLWNHALFEKQRST